LRLGATSVGARGWLTADGELVLARADTIGSLRRRRISLLPRAQLPESVPSLDELLERSGPQVPIALSVADEHAFDVALAVARSADAVGRLWMRHDDVDLLGTWRHRAEDIGLVNTVRRPSLKEGAERRAATLRTLGIDALEARHNEWSGGLVALMHRFGRRGRATDANYPEIIGQLLRMGVDSIAGDHPERLADAVLLRSDAPQ
jgi:hypothetical protein